MSLPGLWTFSLLLVLCGCETVPNCSIEPGPGDAKTVRCSDGSFATVNPPMPSQPPPPTPQILVRTDVEPPGANCPGGGHAIRVGGDTNGNGALDDDEVTSTSYLCNNPSPTTVVGDYWLMNSLDIAALSGVEEITGTLYFPPTMSSIALPSLTRVGALSTTTSPTIQVNDVLESLSLPALETISAGMDFRVTKMTAVTFPALQSITGDVVVTFLVAPVLRTAQHMRLIQNAETPLSLPSLEMAQVDLTLGVPAVDLPSLKGNDVRINGYVLTTPTLMLPSFVQGVVELTGSGAATAVALPSAENVDLGFFFGADVSVSAPKATSVNLHAEDVALTDVSFPAATTGSFTIYSSSIGSLSVPNVTSASALDLQGSGLADLSAFSALVDCSYLNLYSTSLTSLADLGALKTATTFVVHNNSLLPSCWPDKILAQLTAPPTSVNVGSNGPPGVCP